VIFGARVLADGSASGTLARRVAAAVAFGRERPGTFYVVSGGQGAGPLPEWQVMRRLLEQSGVSAEQIIADPDSTATRAQVIACTNIVVGRSLSGNVWIATSRYHQPRCWLLFALNGICAGLVPAPADRPHLSWLRLSRFWLREAAAIPYDAVALAIWRCRTAFMAAAGNAKNAAAANSKERHKR
jgi:uncharacterized SAM-binding protein YcdF (DUF218 family)